MNVVVDASAIGAVIFEEPEGDTVLAHVQHETLVAPELIDYELVNVGLIKIRRGVADAPLVIAMLSRLRSMPIRRMPVATEEVATLALRTGLTAYDAAYLWLALTRDAELVTLDRQLARADRALRGEPS